MKLESYTIKNQYDREVVADARTLYHMAIRGEFPNITLIDPIPHDIFQNLREAQEEKAAANVARLQQATKRIMSHKPKKAEAPAPPAMTAEPSATVKVAPATTAAPKKAES